MNIIVFVHFLFLGGILMRFTIDTELERIIVPDTYYKEIDKMNDILEKHGAGGNKIEYVGFVNEAIAKAQKKPLIRKSDVKALKK